MQKIRNISASEVLKTEFLEPYNISLNDLSENINFDRGYLQDFINGNSKLNIELALKLSKYFGNSPNFWLGIQNDYDLEEESTKLKIELDKIKTLNLELY